MAKRRMLKKELTNRVLSIGYCYLAINDLNKAKQSQEDVTKTLFQLSEIHKDFISRVNHVAPGNARKYFQHLTADFKKALETIVLPEIEA